MGDAERGSNGVLAGELCQHVNQSWSCSRVENEPEERDAMDQLIDEMMRQWERSVKMQRRLR